ncbi:MAG: hypothetical protein ACPG4S_04310, partial [Schleiferiaceae bacterium]
MPTATFRGKRDFNAHRLLRAIDENTLLSKLEQKQQAPQNQCYMHHEQLLDTY